ncbi:DUF1003 domain-containing protein [Oryzomonas rubra]|uniref:Uncharacterized protein n=1 Tax=Oryzomonas rubra TaxID=2509454 RepID=A0A5A9X6F0_9BACT|nr:DUF1003 domain-containing protein [Oryzomonas rubra]KAA0888752.1 hypothetical protein ET418_15340 [Oryzomonas rubra]
MNCNECTTHCIKCDDFENQVDGEADITTLKDIRKTLMQHKVQTDGSLSGKIADWLTSKIGTMACIYLFTIFVSIPFIFPKTLEIVQFVGGTYIPLVLMPLIMVASNRTDKIREIRAEREYRILLVSDRIDEVMGD